MGSQAIQRYAATEALIGAGASAILSFVMFFAIFYGQTTIPFAGPHGLAGDAPPQTFGAVLMSTLVPSLLTRARIRSGKLAIAAGLEPRSIRSILAWVVGSSVIASLILGGAQYFLLSQLREATCTFAAAAVLKMAYGFALGGLAGHVTVMRALREPR